MYTCYKKITFKTRDKIKKNTNIFGGHEFIEKIEYNTLVSNWLSKFSAQISPELPLHQHKTKS